MIIKLLTIFSLFLCTYGQSQSCWDERSNGQTWDKHCSDRGPTWQCQTDLFNAPPRCACKVGFTHNIVSGMPVCIAQKCADYRPDGRNWNEHCLGQGKQCEPGFSDTPPRCACKEGFNEEMTDRGNICKAQTCVDLRPDRRSWNKFCREHGPNWECKSGIQDIPATCGCKEGFKEEDAGGKRSCVAQSCSEAKSAKEGTWSDFCSRTKQKCQGDLKQAPVCAECMEGFKTGQFQNSGKCIAQTCDEIKRQSEGTWVQFCGQFNKNCHSSTEMGPACSGCLEGFTQEPVHGTCIRVKCADVPHLIREDNRGPCTDQQFGDKCRCPDGMRFKKITSPLIVCTDAENWNIESLQCQGTCEDLHAPWDTVISGMCHGAVAGDSCTIECKYGRGKSTRTCGADGKWEGEEPHCVKRPTCPNMLEPTNGHLSGFCDGAEEGQKCSFVCNEKFKLKGVFEITCTSDGKWDGEAPTCEEELYQTCTAADLVKEETNAPCVNVEVGGNCECQEGKQLKGASTSFVTCQEGGQWDVDNPICLELCSPKIETTTLKLSGGCGGALNDACTVTCKNDDTMTAVLTCTASGWTGTEPSCIVVSNCPGVVPPANGITEGRCEGAYPGDRCFIRCRQGFVVRGHITLTCKFGGKWDNLTPICAVRDSNPCHEERDNGKSWGAFCHEVGATCVDSGSRTLCKCQDNQFFDGHQCKDVSVCAQRHMSGKTWSLFCKSIGGVCEASSRYPSCSCHGEQRIDSGVCRELLSCVNRKEDGTEWNEFCREAGGYCTSIGGYPACTCPFGQVFRTGTCIGISEADISKKN